MELDFIEDTCRINDYAKIERMISLRSALFAAAIHKQLEHITDHVVSDVIINDAKVKWKEAIETLFSASEVIRNLYSKENLISMFGSHLEIQTILKIEI